MLKNNNKIGLLLTTTMALTTLSACSTDEEPLGTDSQKEIRLASNVGIVDDEVVTRSNNATNLQSGDTCYVWADMVNASTEEVTEYFNAWTLTANGSGGLSPQVSGNAKLFPATNSLNFYALVGNFGTKEVNEQEVPKITDGETELPATSGIRHTVMADQTTPTAYYKSDLLYAVKLNQEPISEAVQLPFKHLLSRIQVVIVEGNGMKASELSTATVELLGLKLQATITPVRGELTSTLSIPQGATTGNILMGTNVVEKVEDATASAYADAIVVPQTVAANTQLIKVSYLDRDTYYTVPTGGMTFESGKQYRFRLIADRIGETYELVGKSGNEITVETWGAAPTTPTGLWLDTVVE